MHSTLLHLIHSPINIIAQKTHLVYLKSGPWLLIVLGLPLCPNFFLWLPSPWSVFLVCVTRHFTRARSHSIKLSCFALRSRVSCVHCRASVCFGASLTCTRVVSSRVWPSVNDSLFLRWLRALSISFWLLSSSTRLCIVGVAATAIEEPATIKTNLID